MSSSLFILAGWSFQGTQREKFVILFHHLISLVLIAFSFSTGEHRAGSMIFLIHDVSIPILEGSKIARSIGWDDFSDLLYTIFALVFLITRLIVFPAKIMLPIPMHFPETVYYAFTTCGHRSIDGGCLPEPLFTINYYYIWFGLLGALFLIFLYNAILISKVTQNALWKSQRKAATQLAATSEPEEVAAPRTRKLMNSQRKKLP